MFDQLPHSRLRIPRYSCKLGQCCCRKELVAFYLRLTRIDCVNHNAQYKGNACLQARLLLLLLREQWRAASPPSADIRSGAERSKSESKTPVASMLRNFYFFGKAICTICTVRKTFLLFIFLYIPIRLGNTGNAGKVKIGQAYALLRPFIACNPICTAVY